MKLMKTKNMGLIASAIVMGVVNYGHATFSAIDYDVGDSLFLVDAKDSSSSSGNVGSNGGTDALVNIAVKDNADFSSGNATITPVKDATLYDLIFTPVDGNQFCAFSFHAQLADLTDSTTTTITLIVNGLNDATHKFTFTGSGNASDAYGVISSDGETIKTIELQNTSFKQVKLEDFSFCNGTAIPEPSTIIAGALLLLPFGVSTLRIMRRNRAA